MINFINGILEYKSREKIVISTDGIGYEIKIPVSTYEKLPSLGEDTRIYTYLHVREDALELYGFYDLKEKDVFMLLLSVNGIGPRIALSVLSGISVDSFRVAVAKNDISVLTMIPGIGKKIAERVCLELKDKIGVVDQEDIDKESGFLEEDLVQDAVSALVSLGYNVNPVKKAIAKADKDLKRDLKDNKKIETQDIIKSALRYLFSFMIIFTAIFCTSGFVDCPGVLFAEDTNIKDKNIIRSITVEGNKNTKEDVIFAAIKLRVGLVLDPVSLQDDVRSLYELGLFSDISIDKKEADTGGIDLKIIVKERPMINEITFSGSKEYSVKDLEDETTIKKDKIYSPKLLKDNVDKIVSFYRDKGYYLIKVDTKVDSVEKGEKVNVAFNVKEGNKMSVEKITIKGTKIFTEKKLKGEMNTDESSFWYSGIFKENEYKKDLDKIISLYNEEGYAKAKIVSSNITYDESKKKIFIEITIEEGKQYKVKKIDTEVNDTTIHTVDEVKEKIETTVDSIFNKINFEKDINNIRVFYAEKGYIFVRVIPEVNYNDEAGTVELKLSVFEGNVAHVQDILIEGNTKTKDRVIRRELLLRPGEPFDSSKIRRSMEKLYNLGFFDEVTYDILPGFEDGKERLFFKVKERPTGNISLGAGYSTLDGLTGSVGVTENNLFGNGQRVGIMAEFGSRRRNYEISFLEPWFLGYPTSVGFSIYDQLRNYYDDYKDERIGGNVRVGQPSGEFTRFWFTYKYEAVNIFDVKDSASDAIKQNAGRRDTSSITTEVVYDTRDSIFFNTRKGVRHSASIEYAGGIIGGNVNFTRYIVDGRWYKLLFWELVLAVHGSGGYITGFGETPGVPIYEKFFMGGTDTVRGYDERKVGPRDRSETPLGGRVMSYGNLELRYPIIGPLMGVIFADAGATWNRTDEINHEDIATSIGFGIRFTITGALMLRIDYGYGFKEEWAASGGRLHFNLGNIF